MEGDMAWWFGGMWPLYQADMEDKTLDYQARFGDSWSHQRGVGHRVKSLTIQVRATAPQ